MSIQNVPQVYNADMTQGKSVRVSRMGAALDDVTGCTKTAPGHGAHQQSKQFGANARISQSTRRECPSQARLRGSDDHNCSPPPTPPTGHMQQYTMPSKHAMLSSPCSQVQTPVYGAGRSQGSSAEPTTPRARNRASIKSKQHDTALTAAPTIDLAPSKGLSEASELEIYTPWMQMECAASDSIADSSTMDCSCSLPLSMSSSAHTKHWTPVPPSTPHPGTPGSRPASGNMSRSGSYSASQNNSRSLNQAKMSQQRSESSAMSLANSMAMSTSSASCSLELSAALDTSSGGLPPRPATSNTSSFRSSGPRHVLHKHAAAHAHNQQQNRIEQTQQWSDQQKRTAISQMVYWAQRDANYATSIADSLLRSHGLAAASEAATALFPIACSHPSQVAILLQFVLGRPELCPEQAWAMHVLLVRAPKCALETLLTPRHHFQPFQALASIIADVKRLNAAVAQSMARVLHHAAAAGTPVASSLELAPLVVACESLGCQDAVRDLLVALWQQNQNDTDAAHNCLARMDCPEITKPHLDVPLEALKRIEVAGTAIKECFLLVPIAEPPYFGRQRCKFPAVPLADIAPAAAEVASSTLGTGMHGVVVRANLCGQSHALKVSYRTAEASLGLQTEVEAHSRIWAALSERGLSPSPHLCLASFVVYSDILAHGTSVLLVDGLAMPCVDGTLWDFWNTGSSSTSTTTTPVADSVEGAPVRDSDVDVDTTVGGGAGFGSVDGCAPTSMNHTDVTWMALTLADGLCSLHAADSVHNDLHPQNVGVRRLLGSAGGAAAAAAYESHVLDLGRVVTSGTTCERFRNDGSFWPVWHPPEAIHAEYKEGDKVTLSPAADVWAFGCILTSLLYGAAPKFALAEGWGHATWASLADGSMWLQALQSAPKESHGLKEVAAECLRSSPTQRPSIETVRDSLAACACHAGLSVDSIQY